MKRKVIRTDYSKIEGNNLKIIGDNNTIIGNNNRVVGDYNKVKGNDLKIKGDFNEIIGENIKVTGDYNETLSSVEVNKNSNDAKEIDIFNVIIEGFHLYEEIKNIVQPKEQKIISTKNKKSTPINTKTKDSDNEYSEKDFVGNPVMIENPKKNIKFWFKNLFK